MSAATGVFANEASARNAVSELLERGFRRDDISIAPVGGQDERVAVVTTDGTSGTITGLAVGSVIGALIGLLLAVGSAMVPSLMPLAGTSPVAMTLIGAAVGAAIGGLLGALIDLGAPSERVIVRDGSAPAQRLVVTVHTEDPSAAELAADVMRRHRGTPVDGA